MSGRTVLWALALSLLLASGPAAAQTRYLAFGDSITAGVGDDEDRPPAEQGYPPRLEDLLQAAGRNAVVENHGLGGERTPEGLTRIDGVLVQGGDVLLLMEGSNDITRFISREATLFNLDQMAIKAERRGMEAVMATMIPRIPNARVDGENLVNQRTCERIRQLAGQNNRQLVDNFEVFGIIPDVFAQYYWDDPVDQVGHPNAPGYDIMAEAFFDVLTGVDSVAPVTGVISPYNGQRDVAPGAVVDVEVWDFGAGIDLGATRLLINGEDTGVTASGNSRRAQLRYEPDMAFRGVVRVGLSSRDTAASANTVEREIARFVVAGTTFLDGDLDEDGRVDGSDLVRFGLLFGATLGSSRYDPAADFNGDGFIDGNDLAMLATNFGRTSF